MENDFLRKILDHKRELIRQKRTLYDSLKKKLQSHRLGRYQSFKKAISRPGAINLIAEIKKASPSQGIIRPDFDVLKLAQIYVQHKAAALSILTEEKFFLGKVDYVKTVNARFHVPILLKDFVIDEGQIYEAFVNGASAVLLIVAILEDRQLRDFIDLASQFDLDCLVEVHDEAELERALNVGAEIIGINNRDLRSFEIDLGTTERLIEGIFKDKVIVVESGLQTFEDVQRCKQLGAHAVLIGETFLRAQDIGGKIKEVMGPPQI